MHQERASETHTESILGLQKTMRGLLEDITWLDGLGLHALPQSMSPNERLDLAHRLAGALASAIERRPSPVEDLKRDGRAIELWGPLDRLHRRRRALGASLRGCVPGLSRVGHEPETRVGHLIRRIRACDEEESELYGRAFWLDLGTVD